jgi:precorrin-6x reductase
MQGPFSEEMNLALLHYANAEFLVTKNSGREGGFLEKLAAAETAGISTIIIKPPVLESAEKISASLLKDAVKNKKIKFIKLKGTYEETLLVLEAVLL